MPVAHQVRPPAGIQYGTDAHPDYLKPRAAARQSAITRDNVSLSIDGKVYLKIGPSALCAAALLLRFPPPPPAPPADL